MIDQLIKIVEPAFKRVAVLFIGGPIGKPATNMIRNNYPHELRKRRNQIAIKKGPCRVAMNHKHGHTRTFIKVMKFVIAKVEKFTLERIKRGVFPDPI